MNKYQHYEFGLHSNIPLCCVNFWIQNSHQIVYYNEMLDKIKNLVHPNYVRCPECIIKNKTSELHICTKECKEFLESIGVKLWL